MGGSSRIYNHPLVRDGNSQEERQQQALDTQYVQLDERKPEDILDFIYHYAKQVNYYDKKLSRGDWLDFFENSVPFQLALISKYNVQKLRDHYSELEEAFEEGLNQLDLTPLFNRQLELVQLINQWYKSTKLDDSGFFTQISNLISNDLRFALYQLIACANSAEARSLGYTPNFNLEAVRSQEIWELNVTQFIAFDESLRASRGTRHELIRKTSQKLEELFQVFLKGIQELVNLAPDHLKISLTVSREDPKDHTPHLGLLFAFLEVFKQVRDDLNLNTKKHLDFFYRDVLKLEEKKSVPDKAHLIFELAQHLDDFLVETGTQFTAGDDDNGAEMLFELQEELLVQKAQVESIRTLFIDQQASKKDGGDHPFETNSDGTPKTLQAIKGIYAAPQANSADGKGADFGEIDPPSWATLGAKDNKIAKPDSFPTEFEPQPKARLGLILAAQVFYLKEGQRDISISINGALPVELEGTLDKTQQSFIDVLQTQFHFTPATGTFLVEEGLTKTRVEEIAFAYGTAPKNFTDFTSFLENTPAIIDPISVFEARLIKISIERVSPFHVYLSGEGQWEQPFDIDMSVNPDTWQLNINIHLDQEQPPVLPFDPEAFEIDYQTKEPIVKLELNHDLKFSFEVGEPEEDDIDQHDPITQVSLYHLFRDLKIVDVNVAVSVKNVRNLIVQNDDGLLDAAKPFTPFGALPKSGANLYIGSDEVFHKKLTGLSLDFSWEDVPYSMFEHYRMYGINLFKEDFKAKLDILNFQNWLPLDDDDFHLFPTFNIEIVPNGGLFEFVIKDKAGNQLLNSLANANPELDYGDEITVKKAANSTFLLAGNADNYTSYTDANGNAGVTIQRPGDDDALAQTTAVFNQSVSDAGEDVMVSLLKAIEDMDLNTQSYKGRTPDPVNVGEDIIEYIDETKFSNFFPSPIQEQEQFNFLSQNGFLRLQLGNRDFLHSKYSSVVTLQTSAIASSAVGWFNQVPGAIYRKNADFRQVVIGDDQEGVNNITPEPANEPYTPTIKELFINYTAASDKNQIELIHLYPYEEGNFKKLDIDGQPRLLTKFVDKDTNGDRAEKEGNLFIGLKDLIPANTLDILFQVAESTANPDLEQAEVQWHYLKDNTWTQLRPDLEILEDTTNGLISSGVIKFEIPRDINLKNTILPANLYWIKASVELRSAAVSQSINIHTQVGEVVFIPAAENDVARLDQPLPAETIAEPVLNTAALAATTQQYDSFGGEAEEADEAFYIRVSEHLRHKDRAITLFDYERIVLEAFPTIHRVKCITHAMGRRRKTFDYELAPGYLTLAVIPDLAQLKYANKLQPKVTLSELKKIEEYLKSRMSPFVRLQVLNPRYEEIKVKGRVFFLKGKSRAFYKKELERDIQKFLSPWAFGSPKKINFGGKVFKSSIINFIEQLDYVDYVEDFVMLDEDDKEVNEIAAKSARSILVSGKHEITAAEPGECVPSNEKGKNMTGIGYVKIGDKC